MNNAVDHCQAGRAHLRKFLSCPAVPVSEPYIILPLSVVRLLIFCQSDFKEANVGFIFSHRSSPVVVNLKLHILQATFSSSTWNAWINIDSIFSAVQLRSAVVSAYQVTACNIVFIAGLPHWAWASTVRFLYHTQDTPHSIGLLRTSDLLVAETSTWQHTTLKTDIHAPRRDSNPQSQQASGRRPTP